jgi:uncharacterized ferritin-like protein (DUF455 family)
MRALAFAALKECDPVQKVALTGAAFAAAEGRKLLVDKAQSLIVDFPGRPEHPELLHPSRVPQRGAGSVEGRAAMIHAITHIEFNAINLALDAVCRFANLPDDYYFDWITVAKEESYHFTLLSQHLKQHYGHNYGDFAAHGGLWAMAEKTKHDVLTRMALVPRILEARGLDVTPAMRDKLRHHGDVRAAAILDIILRDEVGHVMIGNRWYTRLCTERGVEPIATFEHLMQEHDALVRPPFNRPARLAGGFSEAELVRLETRFAAATAAR